MVDLETLSNSPGGAILSIAAVAFDRDNDLGPSFQQNVSLQDCIDRGMVVDAGTVDWWMEKPTEVWRSIRDGEAPLDVALRRFNEWIDHTTQESRRAWAKGSDFDFGMMLRPAYDRTGVDPFWDFPPRNFRCLRTLEIEDSVKPEIPHDPVEDARAQALDVIHHFAREKGTL